jgi:hypothetical protein
MFLGLKSLRAAGLSLLLTVFATAGFVVTDMARGESAPKGQSSAPAALRGPSLKSPGDAHAEARRVPAAWLGSSGQLRAVIDTPESVRRVVAAEIADAPEVIATPGLHDLGMVTPKGDAFYVVSLLPYAVKKGSTLRGYRVGSWPTNEAAARYAPPAGFIEVTPENEATQVSSHFMLKDFITHDQSGVWPKFLVLKPRLLDKLELISSALAQRGLPSRLHVMSGFRTPQYNEQGVGEKGGRASKSRHMYGDAADVFVDEDGNGRMDDLNGDGRVTVADARVLFTVAESVEAAHPDLVGGLSPYQANSAHGPFVHVDARGTKARW